MLKFPMLLLGALTQIVFVGQQPFKNSRVELRKYISARKQVTITASITDDKGDFDLGQVEKGEYRLLASPTRSFKQPGEFHCPGKECKLTIALQANPTDLPESGCPIR